MKRLMGTIKGRASGNDRRNSDAVMPQGDSPEAIVAREVTAFCESGGPNNTNAGEEYLHLPAIVDAAESSPAAATEAANRIRRFLSKDNHQHAYAQYNAIMLARILTDNPARNFTKNFDTKFVTTVKELLREGRDMSVQQILRETLDYFETEKLPSNETLVTLVEMWRKEKSKTNSKQYDNPPRGPRTLNAPPFNQQQQQQQNYFSSHRQSNRPRGLPPPEELASRIEEAKTTARLLLQTIQSTPNTELLGNDLIKEFADRASSASRSIQSYMNCDNPAPDEDTMLTLIETNEQLSIAMSKHQRAVLQARKALGAATPSPQPQSQPAPYGQNVYPPASPRAGQTNNESYVPPPGPPPGAMGAVRANDQAIRSNNYDYSTRPPVPARNRPISQDMGLKTQTLDYGVAENPFEDNSIQQEPPQQKPYSLFDRPPQATSPQQDGLQHQSRLQSTYGENVPSQTSYSPYNQGYQSTPSYVNRQDSATQHLTMHGASTPPDEVQAGNVTKDPVSPLNGETNGLQRRLQNLNV